MCALGVRVRPSTTIGGALHIDDLFRDGYDAVFVGTGTWRARKLDILGQARGNVFFGIDYLVDPSSVSIGRDVAIIGVGNVAMDVARSALRHGARRVTRARSSAPRSSTRRTTSSATRTSSTTCAATP